ncbi:SET domain-containing protein 9-like [Saccoglossus kowalevskii]|uniref:SET domain-containing protein 9-like n=1 Tax=Saccoglossus kowalevskii TaxID=10224 RepID=A0ABM0GJJ0_SACKO|nr:PREDICTED: SET domain-containing protein 9-like [Saccoglossus kowalevskii]
MFHTLIKNLSARWKSYRYRFVPWIALNFKNRTIRGVPKGSEDKVISDKQVEDTLKTLFTKINGVSSKPEIVLGVMRDVLGFTVEKAKSQVGGTGVYVTNGAVPKGTVLAMYPGTVYFTYEPILLQSIGNPFIFRCLDGLLIDGNDKSISKLIYRSCSKRERSGPYMTSDMSWLSSDGLLNPLALGQYVNNQSKKFPANVVYQEYDVTDDFPLHLMKYIPNIRYSSTHHNTETRFIRTVILVSTRDIKAGEEIFSTYFTMVY